MSQKYLTIDNVSYPVHIAELNRSADVLDATAYRTEDGILHRKVIGTYINYTASIGIEDDVDLYDRLFTVLSAPVESHMVQFPNETEPQQRYISQVADKISRILSNGTLYKELSFSVICTAPTRRA